MGRGGALAALALNGCKRADPSGAVPVGELPFKPIAPSSADALTLAEGFRYDLLIEHGKVLNTAGAQFGFNNDFIEWSEIPGTSDLMLWVNHEYVVPMLMHGKPWSEKLTKAEVDKDRKEVGGSLVRIRQTDGQWQVVENDPLNRRIDGTTAIPLVGGAPVKGARTAIGTLGNCAGGKTPWGSILTCEENFDNFYPEKDVSGARQLTDYPHWWHVYYDEPAEHYGWVVEVNPTTGAAKKLLPLGRFAHECATVRVTRDGRCVVYSGDDMKLGSLYKFIADQPGTLESGTLYVADVEGGRWLPLDRAKSPTLAEAYPDQTSLLIHARAAARLVGGTQLDRPEDIEVDPLSGAVLVSLTNNPDRGNHHGSIMRLLEQGDDPAALEFTASEFLAGGARDGISCPDNLTFDRRGNLWVTNDVSGKDQLKGPYRNVGHNGLFYVPMSGPDAGRVFQVASAPRHAELTGPKFSPDGRTLFLSVQHPGEYSKAAGQWSSHWPHGGDAKPVPAVVTVRGPALDALLAVS